MKISRKKAQNISQLYIYNMAHLQLEVSHIILTIYINMYFKTFILFRVNGLLCVPYSRNGILLVYPWKNNKKQNYPNHQNV